jgi:hypothetical protein
MYAQYFCRAGKTPTRFIRQYAIHHPALTVHHTTKHQLWASIAWLNSCSNFLPNKQFRAGEMYVYLLSDKLGQNRQAPGKVSALIE